MGCETNLRPDIYLARLFVKEKYVLDKHKPSRLTNGREKTVQNASGHKRLESGCAGAPCCCRCRDEQKPKHDWEAAKKGAEHDN